MSVSKIKQAVLKALPQPIQNWILKVRHPQLYVQNSRTYRNHLRGLHGIEIGGPSQVFQQALPVYSVVAELDGVNFSDQTLWEGTIQEGGAYQFAPKRSGRQFIAEASDLSGMASARYQFLISSNCLEHVANPLKALEEWIRVVEPGGLLLLVLPNKESNFDHRRPVTQFEHLLEDYQNGTQEDDMTHLPEILELHDLERDPWAGSRENFVRRCRENLKYRGMHHHIFDMQLMEQMMTYMGITILLRDTTVSDYYILGRTPDRKQ